MTGLAVVLAVVGALCFAVGSRLQHGVVRHVCRGSFLSPGHVFHLIRHPKWVLGVCTVGTCSALHVVALTMAPLVVVQPIGALAVAVSAVLHIRAARRGFGIAATAGLLATTCGLATFGVLIAGNVVEHPTPQDSLPGALTLLAAVVVALSVVGMAVGRRMRCLCFATAAAVCYATAAVLIRVAAEQAAAGQSLTLAVAGAAAVSLIGAWFVQQAYVMGAAHVVVACLAVVDPLVAVAVGAGALGETLHAGVVALGIGLSAAAIAAVGVVVLARHTHDAAIERRVKHAQLPAPAINGS